MAQDQVTTATQPHAKFNDQYFSTDHLRADLGSRTARGGAITMISHTLKFGITLVGTSVMARLLTPQDYGLIGMVAFLTGFLAIFKDMGLSVATIQRSEVTGEQVSTLFWFNVAVCSFLAAVTVIFAPVVAWFYGDHRLTAITAVTASGFVLSGLTVQHDALMRRQMRFLALAGISMTSILVGYIVAISMAWSGWGYWALVASQLSQLLTVAIGVWVFCHWRPSLPKRDSGVRSMIKFGGNFTAFSVVNFFARNLDNLLIGKAWGAQQLGIYSRAYQLMGLPLDQINEPVTSVAIPSLSRLIDQPDRYRQAYLRILEKIAMLTMPSVALMMVTADWIVHIMLGPQWVETTRIFLVLGATGLFQPIANTTGWLFLTQGRSRDMFRCGLVTSPIIVASIVAGLPWGAAGVATSYALTRIFIADPFLYWYVGRSGPVKPIDFYKTMAPFAAASLIGLGVSWLFRHWLQIQNAVAGIAVCTVIMGITYFIVLIIIPKGRLALRDSWESGLVALKFR